MTYIEFYINTYNNLFCVEYQIKTINFFCKDPYKILIIDSNCGKHQEVSLKIKKICYDNNIELIVLPYIDNFNSKQLSSIILGNKLNYIFNNIVKIRQPPYFAFIDHDMFMYKPFTIIDFLDKNGMWGDIAEIDNFKSGSDLKKDIKEGPWIIHPWLSFFKFDFVKNENMNWLPCVYQNGNFDTGGKLWENFIKNKNLKKEIYWFRENINMLYPFKEISNSGPHPYQTHYFLYNNKITYGQIQLNNGFIHMINSANEILHPKLIYVKAFLDSRLIE